MKAAYAGVCARCHGGFAQGEQIVRHRNGFQHLACAAGQDED